MVAAAAAAAQAGGGADEEKGAESSAALHASYLLQTALLDNEFKQLVHIFKSMGDGAKVAVLFFLSTVEQFHQYVQPLLQQIEPDRRPAVAASLITRIDSTEATKRRQDNYDNLKTKFDRQEAWLKENQPAPPVMSQDASAAVAGKRKADVEVEHVRVGGAVDDVGVAEGTGIDTEERDEPEGESDESDEEEKPTHRRGAARRKLEEDEGDDDDAYGWSRQ